MATIGENIKKVRTKLGLTQDDLVRKSGVKHTTLTKEQRGRQARRADSSQDC